MRKTTVALGEALQRLAGQEFEELAGPKLGCMSRNKARILSLFLSTYYTDEPIRTLIYFEHSPIRIGNSI